MLFSNLLKFYRFLKRGLNLIKCDFYCDYEHDKVGPRVINIHTVWSSAWQQPRLNCNRPKYFSIIIVKAPEWRGVNYAFFNYSSKEFRPQF